MPQTLHCVILYSENFHHDDQKAAKKAGIETLVIANFHYTDKIKAVDIQYKAADNDKGLQILTFNWKRPKGMAHANVPDGPKQVAKGYKAALKKMKPSVRLERCVARLSLPTFHPLTILDCACAVEDQVHHQEAAGAQQAAPQHHQAAQGEEGRERGRGGGALGRLLARGRLLRRRLV